jgi:hypothetical protein
MWHRGGDAAVIVAGNHQHSAVRRRAVGIAMFQRIACAVDTGAFSVPQGKDTVDRARRIGLDTLRAEHLGCSKLFVDRRDKADAGIFQPGTGSPDRLVDHAQWRTAIATDETLRVQTARGVAPPLHQCEANQRLCTCEEDDTRFGPDAVREAIVGTCDG